MRLKITDLQRIVEETVQEKKAVENFCSEIKKSFGPTIIIANDVVTLAEQANDRLDVLERTGRRNYVKISSETALAVAYHKDKEVRRLAIRLLPENFAHKFINDKVSSVRAAAAQNSSIEIVEQAIKRYPQDDTLHNILKQKRLSESKPALKSAASSPEGESFLSDAWYESKARKLIQDYGRTLDTGWVSAAVNQYCSASRAVNRYNIDSYKLMKKVVELIADREDERREKLELKESVGMISQEADSSVDQVESLLTSILPASEYLSKAHEVFSMKLTKLVKDDELNESKLEFISVPMSGVLPHGSSLRFNDEVALDTYVKHWNGKQTLQGSRYRLSWSPHPEIQNKIKFYLGLK
jgi:hypothetical protein